VQALLNPGTNIDKGVSILKENYRRYGSWDMAAKAYLGLGGPDAYGTTSGTYWNRIKGYWDELNGSSQQASPGQSPGFSVSTIFGGAPPRISQEFGRTGFSQSAKGQSMYGYVGGLGVQGHAGIDYSMNPGTKLYVPVSGTVITSGGRNFYTDSRYGARPGTGELRIKLDNGDELILGHMQSINLRVGQRVTPGTLAGLSGTNNGGHVHVEYRQHAPGKTSTNYLAVDPRKKLVGTQYATGGHTANDGHDHGNEKPMYTVGAGLAAARQAALSGSTADLAKLVYNPEFLKTVLQRRMAT
jgi:murein DD-endopeptidase MepM/ murein hydrolase activator NlpD